MIKSYITHIKTHGKLIMLKSTNNEEKDSDTELKVVKKKVTKKKTKKKKNYLNNKDLLHEIKESHKRGDITDNLAKMFMTLVERYASKSRFAVTESFKEDMKCFALVTLVKVWQRFNPEKSKNPFAYFTTVTTHAFYQFQNMERKQKNIKNEMLIELNKSPSYAYMAEYEESMQKVHDTYEGTNIEEELIESQSESNDVFDYNKEK